MSDTRWFTELHGKGHGITVKIDKPLVKMETPYQKLEMFENDGLGKVFLLDDVVMLWERDEFIYHEMLVHPGLLAHPDPRRVLIIGGGDGGTLREVVKHPSVEEAVLCEIDEDVITYSREHLPFTACGLDHPKSTLYVGDGLEFIRNHQGEFDAVIVDSTDPVGFAEGLFRAPFYEDVKKALRKGGVLMQQTESPFYHIEPWTRIYQELNQVFGKVGCYTASIPMYPSGMWTFGIASDEIDPWTHFDPRRVEALGELRYYTPEHQRAAFAIPAFARRLISALTVKE